MKVEQAFFCTVLALLVVCVAVLTLKSIVKSRSFGERRRYLHDLIKEEPLPDNRSSILQFKRLSKK